MQRTHSWFAPQIVHTALTAMAGVSIVFLFVLAFHGAAQAEPAACRATLLKETTKLVKSESKALGKCEEGKVKGNLPVATDCASDPATLDKITKAKAKLREKVAGACGGVDATCGTADDDSLASIGWNVGTCPNFQGGTCSNAIGNCHDILDCVICIHDGLIAGAIAMYYGDLDSNAFGSGSPVNKCQVAIGKESLKALNKSLKALAKCWAAVGDGTIPGPCPVPGDGRAAAALADAAAKRDAKICTACGGADKHCDGADDLTTSEIGLPTDCPAVTVPGGESCGSPIQTLGNFVACGSCLGSFAAASSTASDASEVAGCGNGVVGATEDCDPPGSTCVNGETCRTDCTCPATGPGGDCPEIMTIVGTSGSLGVLDIGWTGEWHDTQFISDAKLSLPITGCAGTVRPCGTCTLGGAVANAGPGDLRNQRCTNNTAVQCTTNADCVQQCRGGANDAMPCTDGADCDIGSCVPAGTCELYFGSYLPIAAGGISICELQRVAGAITGTADVETGEVAAVLPLEQNVFGGMLNAQPCPRCDGDAIANDGTYGGVCSGGSRNGLACDGNGVHPNDHFGTTSLDCPPLTSKLAAARVTVPVSTGTTTQTLSAANPKCRATGFTSRQCFCDTCATLAAEVCSSNADCPGGRICGGLRCAGGANAGGVCTVAGTNSQCPSGNCGRPGLATAPNQCDDQTCTPAGGNEGTCAMGPMDFHCSPNATFVPCAAQSDCDTAGFKSCAGGVNAGAVCTATSECPGGSCAFDTCSGSTQRECFTDNGMLGGSVTATGVAAAPVDDQADPTLAALFCIAPTSSGSVNAVSGSPGLERIELPVHLRFLPVPVPMNTPTGTTPTRTPTPTRTKTTTPTRTPTVSPTPTPGPTFTPGNTSCPSFVAVEGNSGALGVRDIGWVGLAHDLQLVSDATLTLAVTGCDNPSRPCGNCALTGPVANTSASDIRNRRCTNNTATQCSSGAACFQQCVGGANDGGACTSSSDCGGSTCSPAGTCEYFSGSYLPMAAGGISSCLSHQVVGTLSGVANLETGAFSSTGTVLRRVWGGLTVGQPCPRCLADGNPNDDVRGGTCSAGLRLGQACDVNGVHPNPHFGPTSLDCPPNTGLLAASSIPISTTTSTATKTLTAASVQCRATGSTGNKCFCDTCASLAAEPCSSNADCPGGRICGGLRCQVGANAGGVCTVAGANSQCPGGTCGRPGLATASNQCDDQTCTPTTGNEGECAAGPTDYSCGPNATFMPCTSQADCDYAGFKSCTGGANGGLVCTDPSECPGGTCDMDTCSIAKQRACFTDNGALGASVNASGVADVPVADQADPTIAALYCVPPTAAATVNVTSGLPGLARDEIPSRLRFLP